MSTSTKPVIVLVPGAWCPSSIYEPLTSRLQKAGYTVNALNLPSNGDPPNFSPDWQPDVRLISSTIEGCADEGKDVVVVAHSAGGASSTEAAQGLSKLDRQAEGKPGGIVRIVYIAAFAPETGQTTLTLEQIRSIFYWVIGDGEIDYPDPNLAANILFTDLPAETASAYASQLLKSAWRARHGAHINVTYAAWKHIPSSYLLCQNDKALFPEMQEAVVAQERSKFDDVVRLQADHSPFVSQPDFVARFVRRAAGESNLSLY